MSISSVSRHRIAGKYSLANELNLILNSSDYKDTKLLLIFDFDRTLTNGASTPQDLSNYKRIKERSEKQGSSDEDIDGVHQALCKLVRGGLRTVQVLEKAKEEYGAQLFIVTAREPRPMSVQQIFASLQNAQVALGKLWRQDEIHVSKGEDGLDMAFSNSIYATGYRKEQAIQHIVSKHCFRDHSTRYKVCFFDDAVNNASLFGISPKHKETKSSHLPQDIELAAYWWDSIEEEFSDQMGMHSPDASDFSYQSTYAAHLKAFGVTEERRRDVETNYRELFEKQIQGRRQRLQKRES